MLLVRANPMHPTATVLERELFANRSALDTHMTFVHEVGHWMGTFDSIVGDKKTHRVVERFLLKDAH